MTSTIKNTFFHFEVEETEEVMPRRSRSTSDLTDCRLGLDLARRNSALKKLEEIESNCSDASTDVSEVGAQRKYLSSDSGNDTSAVDECSQNGSDVEFEMVVDESSQASAPAQRPSQVANLMVPSSVPAYGSPHMYIQSPQMSAQQFQPMSPQQTPPMSPQIASPQMAPQQMSQMQMPQWQQQMAPQQNPLGYVCVPVNPNMFTPDGGVNQDAMAKIEQVAQQHVLQMGIAQGQPMHMQQGMQQMPMQGQMQQMDMSSNYSSPRTGKSTDHTIMLRNIPNKYTQNMLLDHLKNYSMAIDFLYLPTDFKNNCNLGYAFINFNNMTAVDAFTKEYHGGRLPNFRHSPKVLAITKARVQGLSANIKRFRSSSVMGVLSDDAKPALFVNGDRVPFPKPLKDLPPVAPRYTKESA